MVERKNDMFIHTTVFERDIFNQQVETFEEGVKRLVMDFKSIYEGQNPFDVDIIELINNADFESDITFEIWADDCGLSIYKIPGQTRAFAWSNKTGNYDAVVEEI